MLVNVVKSLWSTDPIASPTIDLEETGSGSGSKAILEKQRKRAAAIRAVLTSESALALATLVGRSGKYPLLVNEGVVALTLLSTHKDGGRAPSYLEYAYDNRFQGHLFLPLLSPPWYLICQAVLSSLHRRQLAAISALLLQVRRLTGFKFAFPCPATLLTCLFSP